MKNQSLKKVIELIGSQSALAREIGVKQQNIYHWLYISKKVPAEYVLKIEQAVNGVVSRHELRPDIYPPTD